jgi:rRNA small subunit pseudouridine methyltransferase Nep1
MLNLAFIEASLELVPPEILNHPSVKRNAKRRGKRPEETLLDRSLHHYAMNKLDGSEKRGRPDILHYCLLLAFGSPLNRDGDLRVYANTLNGYSIRIDPQTRPPRDCLRFNSLMEQLFLNGKVPTDAANPLMTLKRERLEKLKQSITPSRTIALSSHGEPSDFQNVSKILAAEENPLVLIGAYPNGPMDDETISLADDVYSVHPESLEAWTVTSRIIYEFEKNRTVSPISPPREKN